MEGFSHYEIYEDGTILRKEHKSPCGFLLSRTKIFQQNEKNGYVSVMLTNDQGKRVRFYLHRLLWTVFKGEIKPRYEIDHIDGNRKNNSLENLRELSRKQNANTDTAKERYRISNGRDKGKYNFARLLKARTKKSLEKAKRVYISLLMKNGTVKVTEFIREAHIGYPRAKKIMSEMKFDAD